MDVKVVFALPTSAEAGYRALAMPRAPGTLPETDTSVTPREFGDSLGLCVAWSAEEAGRVGEIALVPPGAPGPLQVLGRGGPGRDDEHSRLGFARIRSRSIEARPALESQRLSRVQLLVRALGPDTLELQNAGRLRLELASGPTGDRCTVQPGDTVALGRQFLFVVVRRPLLPPSAAASVPPFAFGRADRDGIVGESPCAWALRERIAFVGPRRGHVLIVGASGTGKELVARAVHMASDRAKRPLLARNAATLPEGIVDAELFGNARNYPNPGMAERAGLVGDADGTSLFLDEFGELPTSAQAHLLRVLDDGEYQRLGDSRTRRSDFRLIAATNRSPSELKEDVLARLAMRIETPDLNARREDIPLLARHLLERMLEDDPGLGRAFPRNAGTPPPLSLRLTRHLLTRRYVTHARQLEGVLWRAIEASSGSDAIDLPVSEATSAPASSAEAAGFDEPGDGIDAAVIQRCLDAHNGVIEDAWRELGLSSRHALARLIRKHRVEVRKRPRL